MLRRKTDQPGGFTINALIPNALTVLALCAGMTGIRFALQEEWVMAVGAVFVAAILDGLDGRVARMLKGATKFGAELDSLSDFIAFGVAPGVILYLWSGQHMGDLGWIASLAYATCCGLRLARFNTMSENPDRPAWASKFFTGIAAPAGAAYALWPMVMSFQLGDGIFRQPVVSAVWLLIVGALMVSQVPTFSFKGMKVKRAHVLPAMLAVMLVAAFMVSYPWTLLTVLGLGYLASIPFSYRAHKRLSRAQAAHSANAANIHGRQDAAAAPDEEA